MMTFSDIFNYKIILSDKISFSVSSLIIMLTIVVFTYFLIKGIKRIFLGFEKRGKIEAGSSTSIFLIVRYIIWVSVIIISLDTLGFKVSLLLASFAMLLVGVGLGLQQLFNDVSSGIVILVEQSIKVGDILQLDNGSVGRVVAIGIRTSQIKTRDDIVLIIPNSKLVNDIIINWSYNEQLTRFYVQVGVAYGSDVELVKTLLLEAANHHPEVSNTPSPFVRFIDFGNSSLDFQVFFWVENAIIIENIKSDIRFEINRLFAGNNIQIPFPQRDLHIKDYINFKPTDT
jgi:small-conductance mechanosensitive channel